MIYTNNIWKFLDGKKTFIGSATLFVAGGLLALKVIDQKTFEIIAVIAASITAYGLRVAIKKLE